MTGNWNSGWLIQSSHSFSHTLANLQQLVTTTSSPFETEPSNIFACEGEIQKFHQFFHPLAPFLHFLWLSHSYSHTHSPSKRSLISLAAWIPSSFRFRSMRRLLAAAALSSADCAQPIVRIASTQNVLKVVGIGREWPNKKHHEKKIQETS